MSLKDLGNLSTLLDVFNELESNQIANNLKDQEKNLKEFTQTAQNFVRGLKIDDAVKHLKTLGIEGDDLRKVLERIGYKTTEIDAALVNAGKTGGTFISRLKGGFEGLAAKVGISTKALGLWTAGAVALTGLVVGVKLYNEHIQEAIEKTNKAGEVYREQTSSLVAYEQEVLSLKESLASNTLSQQEEYNAKERLLEIQDDLINSYAFERGELDLLAMSADRVAAAFDGMTASMANKELVTNASAISRAIKEMEEIRYLTIDDIHLDKISERGVKAIKDLVAQYENLSLVSYNDRYGNERWALQAKGNVEELEDALVSLSGELNTLDTQFEADGIDIDDVFDFGGSWATKIEGELEDVQKVIDDYKENYDNAVVWKIAAEGYVDAEGNLQSYNSLMGELTEAQEAYTKAISSSYDTEEERVAAVSEALVNLLAVKSKFEGINFAEDDIGVRDYFQNLFNQIQDSLEQEQLRIDLQATVNGQPPSEAAADLWEKLTAFSGNDGKIDALDIRNAEQSMRARESSGAPYLGGELTSQERAYLQLQAACALYNVTVEEAIALGVKLGLIYDSTAAVADDTANETMSRSEALRKGLSDIWGSIEFSESKTALIAMSKELDGITPKAIEDLAAESEDLAKILEEDGMNAEFLASILQKVAEGEDGFSLIAEDMLSLNRALEGAAGMFDKVTEARKRYSDAMSVEEKDEGFKTYAEALKAINEEIAAGTTNSNAFWASAEFLFGEDQLAEWGWGDGIDQIKSGVQGLAGVFGDAESAGLGLLDKMYQMSQAGELINENGEKLADITRNADGSYNFAIDPSNISALADEMGIAEEAVLACLEAMSMYGDITFYNLEEVISEVDDLGITMDIAGKKVINLQQLEAHLEALGYGSKFIHDITEQMRELDGVNLLDINADTATLLTNIQNLGFVTQDGISLNVHYDELAIFLAEIGFTRQQIEDLTTKLLAVDGVKLESAAGEIEKVGDAATVLDKVDFKTTNEGLGGIVESVDDVNNSDIDDVHSRFDDFLVTVRALKQELLGVVDAMKKMNGVTIPGSTSGKGVAGSKDTKNKFTPIAHYAGGTSRAKDGPALLGDEFSATGEPKPELVVSDGHAYLAGVDGPTVGYLDDGDIVYTASQTKKILRGKSSIHGSIPAYAVGRMPITADDSGGFEETSSVKNVTLEAESVEVEAGGQFSGSNIPGSGAYVGGDVGSDEASSDSSSTSDSEEKFNWIEVAIERISRAIDKLKNIASSAYKSLKTKLGAAADAITLVNEKIKVQQAAYERYLQEAESIDLSDELKLKVQTGEIDLAEYSSDTQDLIKEYQDLYEKSTEAKDAIADAFLEDVRGYNSVHN